MKFNSIKKIFFILTVILLSLQLFAQEYTCFRIYENFVVFGQDTINRINPLGKKEGRWLRYAPLPSTTIVVDGEEIDVSSIQKLPSYIDSMYFLGEIVITERQFYENGKKQGIWYGYYINEELRYKTFFHEKIKYKAFFKDDILLKVIGYNSNGKITMLIKRKKNTDFFIVKRKNLRSIIITEKEVLDMYGFSSKLESYDK